MRITVPDDVAETYAKYSEIVGRPTDLVMVDQLTRCAHMRPDDRFVTLNGAILGELEDLLRGGSVASPRDLIAKVKRLADIQIGGVRLEFAPPALEELKARAEKLNTDVESLVRETVERMANDFFNHVGRVLEDDVKPVPPAVRPAAQSATPTKEKVA